MELINILRRINDQNFRPWSAADTEQLRVLFSSEYGTEDAVPWWFARLVGDIAERRSDKFAFPGTAAELTKMGSVIVVLGERFGWNIDDYGEGTVLLFPRTRMRAFIGVEGADAEVVVGPLREPA